MERTTSQNQKGVPIIIDPLDVLEQIAKKGGKQFAKEVIVEGRKYTDVLKAKDWAYNVENFGEELAELYRTGKIDRSNMVGKAYENDLVKSLGGTGSFTHNKYEFDGKYNGGKTWYEAKSGNALGDFNSTKAKRWKTNLGEKNALAKKEGAEFEYITKGKISDEWKKWFDSKGIKYKENYTGK